MTDRYSYVKSGKVLYLLDSSTNDMYHTVKVPRDYADFVDSLMKLYQIAYYNPSPFKIGRETRYIYPVTTLVHPTKVTNEITQLYIVQLLLGYHRASRKNIILINDQWTLMLSNPIKKSLLGDTPVEVNEFEFAKKVREFIETHPVMELRNSYPLETNILLRRYSMLR